MSVDDALERILAECLEHSQANEGLALRGSDPEGIHEMRVGLRRMRSALSDFRTVIPVAEFDWMKKETKWLIASLAAARDWDVFLAELLGPIEAARPRDHGLMELRTAAREERRRGYLAARAAIRSARRSAFNARVRRRLSGGTWRQSREHRIDDTPNPRIKKLASEVLDKRYKRALKIGRDFTRLSLLERHSLRIALKKLRYTGEFFRSLYPKKLAKPYFHALAEMQNCLGHMNDVIVAEHLLERISTSHRHQRAFAALPNAAGMVVGWHAHSANRSVREAEASWRQLRRMDRFW